IMPLAGAIWSHDALAAVAKSPKLHTYHAAYRAPTLAQSIGIKLQAIPNAELTMHWKASNIQMTEAPTWFHPVLSDRIDPPATVDRHDTVNKWIAPASEARQKKLHGAVVLTYADASYLAGLHVLLCSLRRNGNLGKTPLIALTSDEVVLN